MTSLTQVLKSGIGPKLVPFFKTVAIYFVVLIPSEQPSVIAALLKVLPILSLMAFVLLHGMSLGDEYFYSRRILLGLLFSVVGDVLLVWDRFFIHGLAVFLIAQICYISAFGFKPLNKQAAGVIYALTAVGLAILVPSAEGPLRIGIFVYTVMLMTMVWRAVSRVRFFEDLWTWTKLCSCAGGILFAFSDACIGFNQFYSPIPHAQVLIMTTYYAAQLGISLSVVDCKASYLDSLKNSRAEEEAAAAAEASLPVTGETVSGEDDVALLGAPSVWGVVQQGPVQDGGEWSKLSNKKVLSSSGDKHETLPQVHTSDSMGSNVVDVAFSSLPLNGALSSCTVDQVEVDDGHCVVKQRLATVSQT